MPLADSRICNVCERRNAIGIRHCLKCGTELTDETSRLQEFDVPQSAEDARDELIGKLAGMTVLAFWVLELLACGTITLAMLIWLVDASLFWDFLRVQPGIRRGIWLSVLYLVAAQVVRRFWLLRTTTSGAPLGE